MNEGTHCPEVLVTLELSDVSFCQSGNSLLGGMNTRYSLLHSQASLSLWAMGIAGLNSRWPLPSRDVKQNLDFGSENEIRFYTSAKEIQIFSFSSRKLHKNAQMPGKIISNICLMLSVYKSYQMVKYGRQRNQILQDLTGLEIQVSMKASKIKTRFKTCFQQPKSSFPKKGINDPTYFTVKKITVTFAESTELALALSDPKIRKMSRSWKCSCVNAVPESWLCRIISFKGRCPLKGVLLSPTSELAVAPYSTFKFEVLNQT